MSRGADHWNNGMGYGNLYAKLTRATKKGRPPFLPPSLRIRPWPCSLGTAIRQAIDTQDNPDGSVPALVRLLWYPEVGGKRWRWCRSRRRRRQATAIAFTAATNWPACAMRIRERVTASSAPKNTWN